MSLRGSLADPAHPPSIVVWPEVPAPLYYYDDPKFRDTVDKLARTLKASLLIGVVESTSAYLIGPVYKDVVVYVLFVLVLWFRPQGLMGKA